MAAHTTAPRARFNRRASGGNRLNQGRRQSPREATAAAAAAAGACAREQSINHTTCMLALQRRCKHPEHFTPACTSASQRRLDPTATLINTPQMDATPPHFASRLDALGFADGAGRGGGARALAASE